MNRYIVTYLARCDISFDEFLLTPPSPPVIPPSDDDANLEIPLDATGTSLFAVHQFLLRRSPASSYPEFYAPRYQWRLLSPHVPPLLRRRPSRGLTLLERVLRLRSSSDVVVRRRGRRDDEGIVVSIGDGLLTMVRSPPEVHLRNRPLLASLLVDAGDASSATSLLRRLIPSTDDDCNDDPLRWVVLFGRVGNNWCGVTVRI